MGVRRKIYILCVFSAFSYLNINCVGYQYPYDYVGHRNTRSNESQDFDSALSAFAARSNSSEANAWNSDETEFQTMLTELINYGKRQPGKSEANTRWNPGSARSGSYETTVINCIQIASRGDVSKFIIGLNRTTNYSTHTLDNPDRFYIDFSNTQVVSPERNILVNSSSVLRVRSGQFKEQTARVVFDLRRKCEVRVSRGRPGQNVIVEIVARGRSRKSPIFKERDSGQKVPIQPAEISLAQELGFKVRTIIIDPGHGGKDPGAIGRGGLREKDLVLDIADQLRRLLKNAGYAVYLTRESDEYVALEERTAFANDRDGDLFISIHANAHRSPEKSGIETYFLALTNDNDSRAVAAFENTLARRTFRQMSQLLTNILNSSKIDESKKFAGFAQSALIAHTRREDRGVKNAGFIVLAGARMPSILAEVGFITNPKEEQLFNSRRYRQTIAKALFQAIEAYSQRVSPVVSYLDNK